MNTKIIIVYERIEKRTPTINNLALYYVTARLIQLAISGTLELSRSTKEAVHTVLKNKRQEH